MGPTGLADVANLCLQKAHYALARLTAGRRLQRAFAPSPFKEFVVRVTDGSVEELLAKAEAAEIFAGLPLGRWYPELEDCLLVAVTEKRTKAEIDKLAEIVG
jgi:glycine dehydrogenase subunit 1